MKLELNHLAPYLPYGLKVYINFGCYSSCHEVKGIIDNKVRCNVATGYFVLDMIKPLLLPISSLYTEMEYGKVPMKVIGEMLEYDLKKYTYDDGDVFYGFDLTDTSIPYKVPMEDREIYLIYFDTQCNWFKMVNQFLDVDSDCEHIPLNLDVADYLDSICCDWRYGLIDKGLALDKTKIK